MENQSKELRLHISSPLGVVYDEVVSSAQVKVHDGYMGINKNRLPIIEYIDIGVIFIRPLNQAGIEEYLIGTGLMVLDAYQCNIYTEFLISKKQIETDRYILMHKKIKEKLKVKEISDYEKNDLILQREIAKLKKTK